MWHLVCMEWVFWGSVLTKMGHVVFNTVQVSECSQPLNHVFQLCIHVVCRGIYVCCNTHKTQTAQCSTVITVLTKKRPYFCILSSPYFTTHQNTSCIDMTIMGCMLFLALSLSNLCFIMGKG